MSAPPRPHLIKPILESTYLSRSFLAEPLKRQRTSQVKYAKITPLQVRTSSSALQKGHNFWNLKSQNVTSAFIIALRRQRTSQVKYVKINPLQDRTSSSASQNSRVPFQNQTSSSASQKVCLSKIERRVPLRRRYKISKNYDPSAMRSSTFELGEG